MGLGLGAWPQRGAGAIVTAIAAVLYAHLVRVGVRVRVMIRVRVRCRRPVLYAHVKLRRAVD